MKLTVHRVALSSASMLLAAALLVTQVSMSLSGSLDLYGVRKMPCCPVPISTEVPVAKLHRELPPCCISDGPASTLVDVDFQAGSDARLSVAAAPALIAHAPRPLSIVRIRPNGSLPPARGPPSRTIVLLI